MTNVIPTDTITTIQDLLTCNGSAQLVTVVLTPNEMSLIAAAPTLLAAAQDAFDFLGGVDGAAEIRDKLLAAIANAIGAA